MSKWLILNCIIMYALEPECLLHSIEQAAIGIGLDVNSQKTEFMCFKSDSAVSTLNDKPLKLVEYFTYLGSNISSTEGDVNIGKAWTAIKRLLPI